MEGDFRVGAWLAQPSLNRILDGEREVKLEPKAMEVLEYLARHAGKVLPKAKIIDEIWSGSFVTEEVLTNSIWELRKALGDEAKNPTYIQTVPRRGYRLIATVRRQPDSGEDSVSTLPRHSAFMERHIPRSTSVAELWNTASFWRAGHVVDPAATTKRRSRWGLAGAIGLGAIVLTALAWILIGDRVPLPAAPPLVPRTAVAILPFDNHIDSEDYAWLSLGIPGMLRSSLSGAPEVRVVSAEKIRGAFRQIRRGSENQELDDSFFPEIARRAGASHLLVGSVVKSGAEIRIDAQLEELAEGGIVAAHAARGTDVLVLADELASKIGRSLNLGEPLPRTRVGELALSTEAYRLYTEGTEARARHLLSKAERLLLEAASIDSAFALAYWELHKIALVRHDLVAAEEYFQQALAQWQRLPEPQSRLARASQLLQRGQRAEAQQLLEELLARYPDEEYVYVLLANLYWESNELDMGLDMIARGIDAVPDSALLHAQYGDGMLRSGRYPEAIRQFETYVRLYPDGESPYCRLAEAYLLSGLPERAREEYSRAPRTSDSSWAPRFGRAWSSAMRGRYDQALEEIEDSLDVSGGPTRHARLARSYFLSRVGRYRQATEDIEEGIRLARNQQDVLYEARAHLLAAMLAIERDVLAEALRRTERAIALLPRLRGRGRREVLMLAGLFAGLARARSGEVGPAARHLDSLRDLFDRRDLRENWWYHLLRSEIALAQGDPDGAAEAFLEGEPELKIGFSSAEPFRSIAGNLPFRDGLARAKKLRGDVSGAIRAYRKLLMPDITQRWTGVLEPLHVLELARLLAEQGNVVAARQQYERFLAMWRHAEPGSPRLAEARRFLSD